MGSSSIKADEAPSNAVDAIVRDACESQRDQGILPTPIDNRQFIQHIVEELDNKPQVKTPKAEAKAGAMEREFTRRGGADYDSLSLEKRGPGENKPTPARDKGAEMIAKRLRLLRSKPDWALKLKTVNPVAIGGGLGAEKQKAACRALWAIIHDSCRVFGSLSAAPAKPLWFT